jgi:hypothetical protein
LRNWKCEPISYDNEHPIRNQTWRQKTGERVPNKAKSRCSAHGRRKYWRAG